MALPRYIPYPDIESKTLQDFPDRIKFIYCYDRKQIRQQTFWLYGAITGTSLKWTLYGSLISLCPHGRIGEVEVVDVDSPTEIPNFPCYKSERGNWHLGKSETERLKTKEIRKFNPYRYSYFQDADYFYAIRKMRKRKNDGEKLDRFLLFIHKKN